jgi:hypothetical protein
VRSGLIERLLVRAGEANHRMASHTRLRKRGFGAVLMIVSLWLCGADMLYAQGRASGAGVPRDGTADAQTGNSATQAQEPAMSASPRAQAPFDPSGNWVSLITRDWRFRMVVPGRGEYQGIPLSLAGKKFADSWDALADEAAGKQCEAYGAGVMMLVPERLLISWQDDKTLKVEADAGMQTRLLHFEASGGQSEPPRSWQGYSTAAWIIHRIIPIAPGDTAPVEKEPFGTLKITTDDMLAGIIRKNGVPYSDQSMLTEYWELQRDPVSGLQYLVVTAALHDPVYLAGDYYYTATFLKETDGSKWHPTPCTLTATP